MKRSTLYAACRIVFTLVWLNMVAFFGLTLIVGGTAKKVEQERYYVSNYGSLTEVDRDTYELVRVYEWVFLASCPLLLLSWIGWGLAGKQATLEECRQADPDYFADGGAAQPPAPPSGCWIERDVDGFILGATTRDLAWAVCVAPMVLLLFAAPWGKLIVSVASGRSYIGDGPPTLVEIGMALTLAALTMVFVYLALSLLLGKTTISVRGDQGRCFLGLGPLGGRKPFRWSEITEIREVARTPRATAYRIELALGDDEAVGFGGILTDRRRHFLLLALRAMHAQRKA